VLVDDRFLMNEHIVSSIEVYTVNDNFLNFTLRDIKFFVCYWLKFCIETSCWYHLVTY